MAIAVKTENLLAFFLSWSVIPDEEKIEETYAILCVYKINAVHQL